MNETDGGSDGIDNAWKVQTHWWWALASAAQLTWAISSYRKGYNGGSNTMPLKAFGVASLFVSAGASAAVSTLLSCGINKVEDAMEVGASIRNSLGVRPRAREK